jgi:hypothetical protein
MHQIFRGALGFQLGLFAVSDVTKGRIVCEYAGEVYRERPDACFDDNYLEYAIKLSALDEYVMKIEGGYANAFVLDAEKYFNEAALINDVRACDGESNAKEDGDDDMARGGPPKQNTELVEVLVDGWPHIYTS